MDNLAMNLVPLVELSRGDTLECLHFGAVAVVNRHGKLLAQAGDPHWLTFSRSTLKALQALPFMEAQGPAAFGFDLAQVAMMCASHNGEEKHVAQTQGMLDKAGLTCEALRCGCHVPSIFGVLETTPARGAVFDARYNNCSGKHAGFLAYCVQHGLSLDDYIAPEHPLLAAAPELTVDAKAETAVIELNLNQTKLPAGEYTLHVEAQAKVKYAKKAGAKDTAVADVTASFYSMPITVRVLEAPKPAK